MSKHIEDGAQLSNKACRHAYIGRSARGCPCPLGRCWYREQQARRADGLKAIDPEHWPKSQGEEGEPRPNQPDPAAYFTYCPECGCRGGHSRHCAAQDLRPT